MLHKGMTAGIGAAMAEITNLTRALRKRLCPAKPVAVCDLAGGFTPRVCAFPRSVHVLAVRHLAEDCHRLGNEPERAAALLKAHADAYEVAMIGRGVEPGEAAVRASEFRRQVETLTARIDVAVDVLISGRAAELVAKGCPESHAERQAQHCAEQEIGIGKGWSLRVEAAIARMTGSTTGGSAA
jgi:hypothetical protein